MPTDITQDPTKVVVIDYTNYRGERGSRRIIPLGMRWDQTVYHPERQWLLTAYDVEKRAERDFAMRDIHSWQPEIPLDNLPLIFSLAS